MLMTILLPSGLQLYSSRSPFKLVIFFASPPLLSINQIWDTFSSLREETKEISFFGVGKLYGLFTIAADHPDVAVTFILD